MGTTYSPQQDSECTISSSLVGERGPDEQNWVHKVIKFRKVLKGLSFEQIIIIAVGKKKKHCKGFKWPSFPSYSLGFQPISKDVSLVGPMIPGNGKVMHI